MKKLFATILGFLTSFSLSFAEIDEEEKYRNSKLKKSKYKPSLIIKPKEKPEFKYLDRNRKFRNPLKTILKIESDNSEKIRNNKIKKW